MKTFSRKRSSSIGGCELPTTPTPKSPCPAAAAAAVTNPVAAAAPAPSRHRPAASRGDWADLPDTALQLVVQGLPDKDRPGCRLVCNGWAAAAGAAVARAQLHLSPLPREASRQIATAARSFPHCTALSLTFPNFVLPPHQPSVPAAAAAAASPSRPRPRQYAAPLLGSSSDSTASGGRGYSSDPLARSGLTGVAGGAAATVAGFGGPGSGGSFTSVTHLTVSLGLAGLQALPVASFYRLPYLRVLVLRGVTPALASADAGSRGSGGWPRLGLLGFPSLEDLTLSGLLSYKVLLEAAQVTALRRLSLEGRPYTEQSEFMYVAALRRLSALGNLQHLTIEGPLFRCVDGGGIQGGAEGGGGGGGDVPLLRAPRLDCAAALSSLSCLTALTTLRLASAPPAAAHAPAAALADDTYDISEDGDEDDDQEEDAVHADNAGAGGPPRGHPRHCLAACSWRPLPLTCFPGLAELELQEPGRLHDCFWSDLAASRGCGGWEQPAAALGGGGSGGGGSGGSGSGTGVGGGDGVLRSLSLAAGSSPILDELPAALRGLTRLHLAGVHLDSFSVLSGLRCLAELRLVLPLDGCDTARRHNPALLSCLAALTGLELSSGPDTAPGMAAGMAVRRAAAGAGGRAGEAAPRAGSGSGGGRQVRAAGGGGHAGGGLGAVEYGGCGEQLLLNDMRLQTLARGCRRLAALSFRGTVHLSDTGLAVLNPPLTSSGSAATAAASTSASARSGFSSFSSNAVFSSSPHRPPSLTSLELYNDSDAPATISLHLLPPTLERLSLYSVTLALPPARGPSPPPHAAPFPLLPRCRVLHLDYCRGAPVWRLLPCLGSGGLGPATDALTGSRAGAGSAAAPCGSGRPGGSVDAAWGGPSESVGGGGGGALQELRLQYPTAGGLSLAAAAAVAALPLLGKLQVAVHSGCVPDYIITRMLSHSAAAAPVSPPPPPPPPSSVGGTGTLKATISAAATTTTTCAAAAPRTVKAPALSAPAGGPPTAPLLRPPSPPLHCLSLRVPGTQLSLASLRALARLSGLRSLYLDAPPPRDAAFLASELRNLTALTSLTMGPVYGRDCNCHPEVLQVLGQLQASLLTCRIQQAC